MVAGDAANPGEKTNRTRRRLTLGILLTALAGAFGSLLSLLKVLTPQQEGAGYRATIAPGDPLVHAEGGNMGSLLQAADFKVGDAVLAYPAGKSQNQANLVQVMRLEETAFKPPTLLALTDQGFVAYSAICTHLACTVSWVRNPAAPAASFTECFCHNSIFDPARGAKVVAGPAPIPLAQIGIRVSTVGTLEFTSGFSGPIGPQV
jgi:rieske iron-sulfur protein